MDREPEERQFLGFFGIVKESIKIIFTWRKIFSQITLAFILSLSLIALAHIKISAFLFAKIPHDEPADPTKVTEYNKLSNFVTSNPIELLLFTLITVILVVILQLLFTSAVMYATACVYTLKSITLGGVIKVLPKVWKRLLITNLWSFLAFFVSIVVTIVIFYLLFTLIHPPAFVLALVFILLILHLSGVVYIGVISHLASVISVVEDIYGIQALFKSKNLIKGKLGISIAINILLAIGSMAIQKAFYIFVAHGHGSGFLRLGVAILCFLLMPLLLLFSPVVQTVIYFMCKSYYHENIDKSLLADHLEVHLLAEYLPAKANDV